MSGKNSIIALENRQQMHLCSRNVSEAEGSSRQGHTGLKACNVPDSVRLNWYSYSSILFIYPTF